MTAAGRCLLQGVCAQLSALDPGELAMDGGRPYPRAAFVFMPRDAAIAAAVASVVAELRRRGTLTLQLSVPARAVTPSFLASRCQELRSQGAAEAIVSALRSAGLLDVQGHLLSDPGCGQWRAAVRAALPSPLFEAGASALQALLDLAYALHATSSDHMEWVGHWLERGGSDAVLSAA